MRARLAEMYGRALGWAMIRNSFRTKLRFIPSFFILKVRRVWQPPAGPWEEFAARTPQALLGVPGIRRDANAEQAAYEAGPIIDYKDLYPRGSRIQEKVLSVAIAPAIPRMERGIAAVLRTEARARAMKGSRLADPIDSRQLTKDVRVKAAQLGLSTIGIAQYDPKYTFEKFLGREVGDRVIVCVLEQVHGATQLAPSAVAEKAAIITYGQVMTLGSKLCSYLQGLGFRAVCTTGHGTGILIHYAVQAGLGQLGHNGQLLTPIAGSRCRLVSISTDAPLDFDSPRDYGIQKICDLCQACVRRCPSNAIPRRRAYHRGVEKAKINTKRCLPLVSQAEGCAVCMKVCPVQRYGLAAIYDEFEKSGEILGKETEELEGYVFTDGRHYGPGEKPKLPNEYFFEL
jgi:epoxyqueuosine reductase